MSDGRARVLGEIRKSLGRAGARSEAITPLQGAGPRPAFHGELVERFVAKMLEKLRIEFTRSRPRRSNDNGLAETKNGAVVRKIFGYEHVHQRHAVRFNIFCVEYLNPFLNFHRPCLFATELADPKKPGRIKRVYRAKDVMTPLDKLTSLPDAAKFLLEGITLKDLHALAGALTDVQAAEELNEALLALFRRVPARTG